VIVNVRCRTCPRARTSCVPPIVNYAFVKGEIDRNGGGILGEVAQGFGEAELPEHLIARDRPFARCVEEDVCLLLGVLVIVGNGAAGLERRVVDGQVKEGGRQSAHLPCWWKASRGRSGMNVLMISN
jgi:hypothetical protein